MKKNHIGKTRIAAAKILSKQLGFEVRPEDIIVASGQYKKMDVYRWELFGFNNGIRVWAGSWERLTDFVKVAKAKGCFINDERIITYGKSSNG